MAYNGTDIKDLDVTTPDGTSEAPSVLDDSDREIKTVLKNQYAVVAKTAAYTLTTSDSIVTVDTSGGDVTITLPAVADVSSSTFTKEYTIIKTHADNVLTLDGDGSETINGSTTQTATSIYAGWKVVGNGTVWIILPAGPLGDDTVSNAAMQDDSVDTDEIVDNAVTSAKLASTRDTSTTYTLNNGITQVLPQGFLRVSQESLTGGYLSYKDHGGVWRTIESLTTNIPSQIHYSDGTNLRVVSTVNSSVFRVYKEMNS